MEFNEKYNTLKKEVLTELTKLLKQVGGATLESGNFEFFNYHDVSEMHIENIDSSGIILDGYQEGNEIQDLIDCGSITLSDGIGFVEDLKTLIKK